MVLGFREAADVRSSWCWWMFNVRHFTKPASDSRIRLKTTYQDSVSKDLERLSVIKQLSHKY